MNLIGGDERTGLPRHVIYCGHKKFYSIDPPFDKILRLKSTFNSISNDWRVIVLTPINDLLVI
jgi:hypothetical protein